MVVCGSGIGNFGLMVGCWRGECVGHGGEFLVVYLVIVL